MQVIRHASLTPVAWKNGGGITCEALRVPDVGPFRWRVSVAYVERSGPFSDFAQVDRVMVLLRGGGVRLTFDEGESAELREVGDLVTFDGGRRTDCALRGGPCVDLNLMVLRPASAKAWVEPLNSTYTFKAAGAATTLVFGIRGTLEVRAGEEAAHLEPWDLAVMPPAGEVRPSPGQTEAPLVFFAALDDNSG